MDTDTTGIRELDNAWAARTAPAIRVMASPRSSSQRSRNRPSIMAAWKIPISSPRRLA